MSRSGLSTFTGLRVVEMGVWVAAPSAAALLADWGADVIKVEAPAGDPMRQVFGSLGIDSDMPNPAFSLDNRGKRSVVLNLRDPEGRRHLEDLLATADVFITNLRPDSLEGLGLEPEATVARHPRLVYCSISGYGLRGDDRNRPTYDIGAFWARSGLSMQMADHQGSPLNARGGIGDHITGLAALAGLLAAVMEQRDDGSGAGGRGVAPADRHLCARVGPRAADDPREGGPGRVEGAEPGPADEPVPRRRRPLVLPHRSRGGAPHRRRLPRPRPPRAAGRPTLRRCHLHPPAPDRCHRHPGRDHRRATPGGLGRAVRRRRGLVGPGADPGRGRRRPPAAGQRRHRGDRRRWHREPCNGR